jgi:hypothetical protein
VSWTPTTRAPTSQKFRKLDSANLLADNMVSNKNMVTDCLLAKVNFPLYAAEMLTSRFESFSISKLVERKFLMNILHSILIQAFAGSWRWRISENRSGEWL